MARARMVDFWARAEKGEIYDEKFFDLKIFWKNLGFYNILVIRLFISFPLYPNAPLLTNDLLIPSNPFFGGLSLNIGLMLGISLYKNLLLIIASDNFSTLSNEVAVFWYSLVSALSPDNLPLDVISFERVFLSISPHVM